MEKNTSGLISSIRLVAGLGVLASSLALGAPSVSAAPLPIEYSECLGWGDNYVQVYVGSTGEDPVFESVNFASSATSIVISFVSLTGVSPRDVYIEPWFYSDSNCATKVNLAIAACVTPIKSATVDNYPAEPYPIGFFTYMTEVSGADPSVRLFWSDETYSGASIYPDYNSFLYGGGPYGIDPIVPVGQVLDGWVVITLLSQGQIDDLNDNAVDSEVAAEWCEASVTDDENDIAPPEGERDDRWSGLDFDIDLDHYRRRAEQPMLLPDTL